MSHGITKMKKKDFEIAIPNAEIKYAEKYFELSLQRHYVVFSLGSAVRFVV